MVFSTSLVCLLSFYQRILPCLFSANIHALAESGLFHRIIVKVAASK